MSTYPKAVLALLFACVIGHSAAHAQFDQQIMPPSPDVASLGKYGDIPISQYTGKPNITVPLGTIGDVHIQQQLSLSYHASGVKINDVANRTGLNWSLIAGGSISRQVRGLDDFNDAGYLNITDSMPASLISFDCSYEHGDAYNLVGSITAGHKDSQADLYFVNFNGYSGQMVMDRNWHVYMIPQEKFKVNPPADQTGEWTITTPDGVVYTFGGDSGNGNSAQETTFKTDVPAYVGNVVTAWHLTSIETPSGHEMTFEYEPYNIQYDLPGNYMSRRLDPGQSSGCDPDINVPMAFTPDYDFDGYALSRILYSDQEVIFTSSGIRCDVTNGLRLDEIEFYAGGDLQKTFELDYLCEPSKDRLWLEEVTEVGSNGNPLPPYEFEYYNRSALPARLSPKQDHWGYHNSNPHYGLLPPFPNETNGADRSTDPMKVINGTISKITYPTGGYTQFEFEACQYWDQLNGTNEYGGGIRIKKITDHDGLNAASDQVRTYEYENSPGVSSGWLMREPRYFYPVLHWSSAGWCVYTYGSAYGVNFLSNAAAGNPVGYSKVTEYYEDAPVSAIGKTEYEYFNYTDQDHSGFFSNPAALYPYVSIPAFIPNVPTKNYSYINGTLKRKKEYRQYAGNYYLQRDLEHNTTAYPEKTIPSWVFSGQVKNEYPFGFYCAEISGGIYYTATAWIKKYRTTETLYDGQGTNLGNAYTKVTNYEWDNAIHQIAEQTTTTSLGEELKSTFTYPENYTGGYYYNTPVSHLISKNMLNFPIREDQFLDGQQIAGKITQYNANAKPNGIYVWNNATGVYEVLESTSFNAEDVPVEHSQTNGYPISYIWDEVQQLPVAKVVNAAKEDVACSSFETDDLRGFSYTPSGIVASGGKSGDRYLNISTSISFERAGLNSTQDYVLSFWAKGGSGANLVINSGMHYVPLNANWTYHEVVISGATDLLIIGNGGGGFTEHSLDEVRLYPVDALMSSMCYDKAHRIVAEIDENNVFTTYEYDEYGRLERVRDNDGNIVVNHTYHFGN